MIPQRRSFVEWPARVLLALALLAAAARGVAAAEAPWQLRHADEASGTAVYLRQRSDGLTEFRAVTTVSARLSTLTAALLDSARLPQWVYRMRSVSSVRRISDTEGINRVILAMPWPFDDREALVHWRLAQDAASLVVTLRGSAVAEALPRDPAYVRMPAFESHWRFSPRGQGRVEVEFEGGGNPGGNLDSALLRGFVAAAAWEGPLATMQALRQQLAHAAWRTAEFDFIREPPP